MNLRKITCWIFVLNLMIAGCSSKEEQPASRLEANQKLEQILKNDYGYTPVIRWEDETLWIYLPTTESLYAISGAQPSSAPVKKKYTLQYIESNFDDSTFTIAYDVVPATKVSSGSGLSTRYSPTFNEAYRNATTALSRTFFSAENPPQFIVLVVTDITNGIKAKTVFFTEDLKKYFTQSIPPEEYAVRVRTEPSGDPKLAADTKGKSLEYHAILLTDFLAQQITQRINFKFQSSDFPPNKSVTDEILDAAVKTIHAYDFQDFSRIILHDLREEKEKVFSKADIDLLRTPLPQEKPLGERKIITLDFSHLFKGASTEEEPVK